VKSVHQQACQADVFSSLGVLRFILRVSVHDKWPCVRVLESAKIHRTSRRRTPPTETAQRCR
jgi:hypothetical protein